MLNVYSFFAVYLLGFSFVELALNSLRLKKAVFLVFGILPLALFVGLRGGGVDDDYYSYIKYFELAPPLSNFFSGLQSYEEATTGVEKGFSFVASLLVTFGGTPVTGIFLFALANFCFCI